MGKKNCKLIQQTEGHPMAVVLLRWIIGTCVSAFLQKTITHLSALKRNPRYICRSVRSEHPDRLWGPLSFLTSGYRSFLGEKPLWSENYTPPSNARFKNIWSFISAPHTSSRHGAQDQYLLPLSQLLDPYSRTALILCHYFSSQNFYEGWGGVKFHLQVSCIFLDEPNELCVF